MRLSFAIAGAAALLLTACSGGNDDAVNADANATVVEETNLDTDAANAASAQLESETLANQAAELNEVADSNAAAPAEAPAATSDDEAMNVAGM